MVHSDMVGTLDLSFPDGYRFVCTILDDFSRFPFLGFLKLGFDQQYKYTLVTKVFEKVGSESLSFLLLYTYLGNPFGWSNGV